MTNTRTTAPTLSAAKIIPVIAHSMLFTVSLSPLHSATRPVRLPSTADNEVRQERFLPLIGLLSQGATFRHSSITPGPAIDPQTLPSTTDPDHKRPGVAQNPLGRSGPLKQPR